MAAHFSWSDTIKITFSSCLPCFSSNSGPSHSTESLVNPNDPTTNHVRRARVDELEGLLADVPDTDTEAERMSLHSNPGRSKKRSKRKKRTSGKRISVFGYDLFGKPVPPPIQLPESDDEGAQSRLSRPPTTRSSSLTFDLDAAPLDPATIATISTSSAQLSQRALALEAEAELRRETEERRAQRRERKELKRIARAMALSGEEFEGFQGSGAAPAYQRPEDYGPFVRAQPPIGEGEDGEADAADLDGGLYARGGRSGNAGSGSDSRSRTSASQSDQYLRPHGPPPELVAAPKKTKTKSSGSGSGSGSGSKKSRSNTSTSTSQSPSLPSPVSPSFPAYVAEEELSGEFPSRGLGGGGGFPSQGFPIQGFGGANRERGKRRDSVHAMGGAFLATRGGDIDG